MLPGVDDAWWRVPGASVAGHRGAVRARAAGAQASCSCGRPFLAQPDVAAACLALLLHLQAAVRDGAPVTGGDDDDGLGGVREPRRPPPSSGGGGVELDIA
jgi:hypothetical protein